MRTSPRRMLVLPPLLVLFAACGPDASGPLSGAGAKITAGPVGPAFAVTEDPVGRDAFSWSEPVWLGPVVNSSARDWKPSLSPHGLSLYFHSNRTGGLGGFDIWVSRRAGPNCPWQAPVDLGPAVNTGLDDGDVNFTPDGHGLLFSSTGHGGAGAGDIFMARRTNPNDDFGWGEPVNLGPDVNTALHESNPEYVAAEDGGTLYFERSVLAIPSTLDIYRVSLTRDGETRGPAVLVSELSAPGIADASPAVRADGRELIFWSGGAEGSRPGGVGLADLWVSTRESVNDPWSPPQNLGTPLNSRFAELSAALSQDGRTLFFTAASGRGGLGLQDMWMSTRGPSAGAETGKAASCGS
jgi:WD40 repeat protein